jgi:hypothetical protein
MRGLVRIAAVALGVLGLCGSASAVSAASGAPRWFYCGQAVPKNTGAFADKSCSVPSSPPGMGKYELLEGVGKGKSIKLKGTGLEEVTMLPPGVSQELAPGEEPEKIRVHCRTMKGSGRPIAPAGMADVVLTFSKCAVLGAPCQNGTKKGVITTEPLAGQLGWLEGSSVGIDLTNEAEPGIGPIASYTCTEVGVFTVVGSVIAQQTGDIEAVSTELGWRWAIGPYLGEVEFAPRHVYTPLVNTPSFLEGPDDYLSVQVVHEEKFFGELPSGLVGEATGKGEALEARG